MKKTIYIAIELKVREFLSNILLSFFFVVKKNYRVILGSKDQIIKHITEKNTKGGVLIYKAGIHKDYINILNEKIDVHSTIDQEIGPGLTNNFYLRTLPQSFHKETAEDIDQYFCLNSQLHKIAKKKLGKHVRKVVNSGWPRFEIFNEKYKNFFQNEVNEIKKKYKNFILFNSDLLFISKFYKQQALHYIPWSIENNKKATEIHKKFILDEAVKRYKEFLNIIEFFKKISQQLDTNIVIRPHPGENIEVWKDIFSGYKNIFIEPPRDDVHSWIIASKGVLHRGCTTAYQAMLIKKPTGYLLIGTDEEINDFHFKDLHFKKNIFDFSYKIRNITDFQKWNKNKKLQISKKNFKKLLQDIGLEKKRSPCNLIIDSICREYINKEPAPLLEAEDSRNKIMFYYFFYKNLFISKIFIFLTKLGVLNKNIEKYGASPKIYGGIQENEINYYLKKLNKKIIKNNKNLVRAVQLKQDLVIIER